MSKIDDLIAKKSKSNPAFAKEVREAGDRLNAAVLLMTLRTSAGLTQRQLAEMAGKPQSTIARIENGNMDVSVRVLNEIARCLGKRIELKIVSDESAQTVTAPRNPRTP